ncbi:hypothetical protein IRJ41_007791 [Triplophysa rosa]|uniref:Integrase catalytic domain-containing protein n=1 Tax=Triplophysa rosa TaxID=992332 RepID=A0A9W7WQL5_TRIRA|nr:hypothetical protein IRJ41_007791 [Triplophysa rosa]
MSDASGSQLFNCENKHLMEDTTEQSTVPVSQMLTPAEELSVSPREQPVRSSSRKGSLTEKGLEMQSQRAKKNEKAFYKAYDSWKQTAKETRSKLKILCSHEDLDSLQRHIQCKLDAVNKCYAPLLRNQTTTPDIVKEIDACTTLTAEICDLVSRRMETIDEGHNEKVVKERVRQILNKDEFESIFGCTNTNTVISEHKRADAEAELAAKVEQAMAMQEIHEQQAKLCQMENDWKLREARMLTEIKEKEAVMCLRIEEQRKKLERLNTEKEVKVAAAHMRAYNGVESYAEEFEEGRVNEADNKPHLNPEVESFHPHQTFPEVQTTHESMNVVQALVNSLSISQLPIPEPATFSGDPLKFIDWKLSFTTLIDRKLIPAGEKMFYLKTYLGGEARKAVEGFFYRNSEDAYKGAWKVLEERYGNPFPFNDPVSLREFSDFLQGCVEAIPHVKGLTILNDCEENYKLLKKLPDWIVRNWNKIVVEELDSSGDYPSFKRFSEFMQKESKLVCNPRYRKRAKAFHTRVQVKGSTQRRPEVQQELQCPVCKSKAHNIAKCPIFAAKSIDDKRSFIREKHLCFGCLKKGHITKNCKTRHTCGTCGLRHPTCLHEERDKNNVRSLKSSPDVEHSSQETQTVISHALTQHVSATSSIVPVFISATDEPQNEILTYALLDTQSDTTFILKDFLEELHVNREEVKLRLSTMTTTDTLTTSHKIRGLRVRGLQSKKYIQIPQAYTCDFIPVDKAYIPTKKTALQWPHLKHIAHEMPPLQSCDIGMLIGYDCPSALAPLEVITGVDNEPFAQKTSIGWSIIGLCNPHLDRQGNQSFVHRVTVKEVLVPSANDVLKVLESDFNEKHPEDKHVSQEDIRFIRLLSDNVQHKEDGHYQLPLQELAMARLQHLKKRLKNNQQYYESYKTFMEEMCNKGEAEPAPTLSEEEIAWYIPHHGVYHPQKPGKLRVVFDCSAKFCGVSLNDTLLTGPDLINSLVGVLCRFRRETIAVTCDIEKMFHQFFVPPEERNYLRFLWWEDGDLGREPREYRMAVHLFGAASSPGCANFGFKYLAEQYKSEYPSASSFIQKNFYVDDGLMSVPSIQEAKKLIVETQALCKRGGLHLHKFSSNEEEALHCADPSEWAIPNKPLNLNPEATECVLGIQWAVKDDTFRFDVKLKDHPSTRRGILSVTASLYDPLGFVSPFLLKGKIILQELCRRNIGWDDPLPEDIIPWWEKWKSSLQELKDISIPRCYHPPSFGTIIRTELHHFSDASNLGYGACSYLRFKNDQNDVHCSLVMAKARVAPTKILSIPRMELSAAVVSAKLSAMLKTELEMKIDQEFFWTDSQVVLAYVKNEATRFHVFVANSVQLIRRITDVSQWYYVNTSKNPADHASRGLYASDILSPFWLSGPEFLREPEVRTTPHFSNDLLVGDPEVRLTQNFATRVSDSSDLLSRFSRFSSWRTLIKVVARIKRLLSAQKYPNDIVTVEECERASDAVIKLVQQQAFSQDIRVIQGRNVLQSTSALYPLDHIMKRGLLCVGGRLKQSSLSEELKHPVILPKDSHIVELILAHYHAKVCHQGRYLTLMELRANGFWVIGGGKSVAKLIHGCVQCRKLRRPTEQQQMAELPKERVEASAPFLHAGMDCFGPFSVKRFRKEHKRYGIIFTCLSSRAVHIEMLENLSTDTFINALRCFISLRGAVRQLFCDCGTNFVGARNELRNALKECDVKSLELFLNENQCEFVFNAPSTSHTGGVWERQIRSVHSVLNATLSQCPGRLDDSSLRTLFYEAMAIINSCPLTIDGINNPKSLEPLTPNHLILMKSKIALPPPGKFQREDMYASRRWRRVQYLIEQFWSRWKREYLLNISTRQKWHVPRRNLSVNDIVIIKEDMLPRSRWQLGRVVEVTQESDGLVRRVKIQTGEQNPKSKQEQHSKPTIIERPIQKLVVLLESE